MFPSLKWVSIFFYFTTDGRFLIVKNLTGKSVSCPASDSMTVLDLKHIILEKEGVPLEQQRLIYKGCNLEDNAVIGESGLNFGDCIHLVLKLRGGLAEDQETEKQKGLFSTVVVFIYMLCIFFFWTLPCVSRGQVLRRFWKLKNIVHDYLEEKDELSKEKAICVMKKIKDRVNIYHF